jgi:hypothetical protein
VLTALFQSGVGDDRAVNVIGIEEAANHRSYADRILAWQASPSYPVGIDG